MKTQKQCFKELTKLSKGWKVKKWESYGEGFSLTISKGNEKKILHVIATDLGIELDSINDICCGKELSSDLHDMAHEINYHCLNEHGVIVNDVNAINIIENDFDINNLLFGFICRECDEEWWISLEDVKRSDQQHMKNAMMEPETRNLIFSEDYLYGHNWEKE